MYQWRVHCTNSQNTLVSFGRFIQPTRFWALPLDVCVHELFEQQAAQHPDSIAIVSANSRLSYNDLNSLADEWAQRLRELGVRPDILVGVCMERTPALIAALLAVSKAGGAFVPLDPEYPADRLRFMLEDSAAAVLLTESAQVERLAGVDAAVLIVDGPGAADRPGRPRPVTGRRQLQ